MPLLTIFKLTVLYRVIDWMLFGKSKAIKQEDIEFIGLATQHNTVTSCLLDRNKNDDGHGYFTGIIIYGLIPMCMWSSTVIPNGIYFTIFSLYLFQNRIPPISEPYF